MILTKNWMSKKVPLVGKTDLGEGKGRWGRASCWGCASCDLRVVRPRTLNEAVLTIIEISIFLWNQVGFL